MESHLKCPSGGAKKAKRYPHYVTLFTYFATHDHAARAGAYLQRAVIGVRIEWSRNPLRSEKICTQKVFPKAYNWQTQGVRYDD